MMIDKENIFKEINEGVVKERFAAFERNLAKNMEYIERYGGLERILSKFDNKNVIIIGAGPTREDEYGTIRRFQYRNEVVIISTDMALLPLMKRGVCPSFVISCETMPFDFFSSIRTEEIHLLAFSCMSNSNLRKWEGDISFYNWMKQESPYNELWEMAGQELGYVATGSIVTTQAVSFALGCNINSLLLVGNDLGFTTEFYTKGTQVFDNNHLITNRFIPIESVEINTAVSRRKYMIDRGERIFYTNNQFLAAKLWLEELFKKVTVPIYDNSDFGCSEESVRKISVEAYFSRFERRSKKKR